MSSKTADKKQGPGWPGSLAARMTFWYTLSAFALVLTASGFLYHALSEGLAHEDDILLSQNLQSLTAYMNMSPNDLEDLQKFVGEKPKWYRTISFWTRVLDNGRILTETPGMSQYLPLRAEAEDSPNVPNLTVRSPQGRTFRVFSAKVFWPGYIHPNVQVQMAIDMNPDEEILRKFRNKLFKALGVSFLACALAGYWIAHRGIRPVRKMADTAARISSHTLYERLERSGLPSELSDLAATFNGMLDRLEESFTRLSRFSSDIAHELRTPLQNLRGKRR